MKSTFFHERSSKRRKGFPSETSVKRGFPRRSRRQGAERKARAQRFLPVRFGTPLSRNAACGRAVTMAQLVAIT